MPASVCSLLAGDIGATKTTLAFFDTFAYPNPPLLQQTFQNASYVSFETLLEEFLARCPEKPRRACFGVAGPVLGNTARMTNLNWLIDGDALRERYHLQQVLLLNDLLATARGVIMLAEADLLPLNQGKAETEGVKAVLAPGSGLGEAFLVPHGGAIRPFPSEGGHASFAPRTPEQLDLLAYMLKRHPHVSVEMVCSGLAIPELFAFLATRQAAPSWILSQLEQVADRTPVIVQAALAAQQGEEPCDIAVQTVRLFVEILADEAANLTLKTLALGGLYLGGGLVPRLLPFLTRERFMPVFARGTYRELLAQVPIRLVLNSHAALYGAAAYGAAAADGSQG